METRQGGRQTPRRHDQGNAQFLRAVKRRGQFIARPDATTSALAFRLAVGHPALFTVDHTSVLHTSGARTTTVAHGIVLCTSGARATVGRIYHLVSVQRNPSRH